MEDIKVIILTLLGIFLIMSYVNSSKPIENFTKEEIQQQCNNSNAKLKEANNEMLICNKDRGTHSINDELNCRFVDDRYIVSSDDASSWCNNNIVNNTTNSSNILYIEKKKEPLTELNVTGYDGKEYNYEYKTSE